MDVLLSLQSAGSKGTMPYAEIGANLNNSYFGLLLWGGIFLLFLFFSIVILKILRADNN